MRVTLRPRDSRIAAREAAAMPLPSEDTTPPVTKTNLVMSLGTCLREPRHSGGRGAALGMNALVVKRDYTGVHDSPCPLSTADSPPRGRRPCSGAAERGGRLLSPFAWPTHAIDMTRRRCPIGSGGTRPELHPVAV